ncbi:hypothetical protein GCM10010912_29000 [Paenibacillus albidus]|uniref:Uncharacterized protein n=1 Tax=Paenibacillus albidus TaxID=2041023 RepID=A0A917CAI6_9BACL|nr:CLC_0170 family protein [Paenibacillus albidus]GGF82063.1 hypothetical protein GCM10010912_29000 [Paenibacillus albidus]
MFRELSFLALSLLLSGGLLLTVDSKIYAVSHMAREKKYARILGWTQLLLLLLILIFLILFY